MPIQPKDTETILKEFSELYEKVKSASDMQFVTGEWFYPALRQALASHLLWAAENSLLDEQGVKKMIEDLSSLTSFDYPGAYLKGLKSHHERVVALAQKIVE